MLLLYCYFVFVFVYYTDQFHSANCLLLTGTEFDSQWLNALWPLSSWGGASWHATRHYHPTPHQDLQPGKLRKTAAHCKTSFIYLCSTSFLRTYILWTCCKLEDKIRRRLERIGQTTQESMHFMYKDYVFSRNFQLRTWNTISFKVFKCHYNLPKLYFLWCSHHVVAQMVPVYLWKCVPYNIVIFYFLQHNFIASLALLSHCCLPLLHRKYL